MKQLEIAQLRNGSVLVIGDVMLDTFIYGAVSRISPEAPIPILSVREENSMPGGAANVALNVAALGTRTSLIGLVGDDEAGRRLSALLAAVTPSIAADLVIDKGRPTTVKTRYVGNRQQILRADRECKEAAGKTAEDQLIERFEIQLRTAQVVAMSDYAKGALTDRVVTSVIRSCNEAGVPLVVDPKRPRWDIYRGAAVIKPNLQELARATGLDCSRDEDIDRAAAEIVDRLSACVLLTRSQQGMSLYRSGRAPVHARAVAHEVFDVSGAGDTALAAFCAALSAGISEENSMRIANVASGIAVTRLGTTVVSADELTRASAVQDFSKASSRVVSREFAARICQDWRERGLTIGFTNGCFDLIHAGHVSMLSRAASHCDRLVVALNSDASVRRLKGIDRPVQLEFSRTQVIAALEAPSLVTVFEEDTPLSLIELLKPDVLFKGADYREEQVVGGDLVKSWGGKVVLIELLANVSTTDAIRRARGLQ